MSDKDFEAINQTISYSTSEEYSPGSDPVSIDPMLVPSVLETSVLALLIIYLVNWIIKPLLVEDRNRWFVALEKLTSAIDRLADRFEELETRIDRIEDRLK